MKTAFAIFYLVVALQLCLAFRGWRDGRGRGHRGMRRGQERQLSGSRNGQRDMYPRRGSGGPSWDEDSHGVGWESRRHGRRGRHSWRDRLWSRLSGGRNKFRSWFPGSGKRFRFGMDPWFDVSFSFGEEAGTESWWTGPNVCFTRSEDQDNDTTTEISAHVSYHSQVCDGSDTAFRCKTTFGRKLLQLIKLPFTGSRMTACGWNWATENTGRQPVDGVGQQKTRADSLWMEFGYREHGPNALIFSTEKMTPEGKFVVTETYECCPGFARSPGEFGCEQEVELQDIPDVLEALELTEMLKLINNSGLSTDIFKGDTNKLTIFAPRNEAFQAFPDAVMDLSSGIQLQDMAGVVMVSEQISQSVVDSTQNILLGHVVVGQLSSPQLEDNQILETASPLKTRIRINTYQRPVKLLTANCRKVVKPNNVASNGVVHVIEEVLTPINETLLDIVSKDPNFSTLKTALGSSGLGSDLRQDGHYTLFAPTDTAFKKHKELMAKVLSDPKCLENVLKNHVFSNVICSAVIQGETTATNQLNKQITLRRDENNKLYADDIQIVAADTMATNGVLYIIDDVLMPEEALGLLDNAEKQGLTEFVGLINQAGLKKEINNMENVTIFIPSNEAILDLQIGDMGKEVLQEVLKYHVVPDVKSRGSFYNNYRMDTASGGQLRVNEYSSFPFGRGWVQTVQCVQYISTDKKACNGIFHVVDKVLLPPAGDVIDVVAQDKRLSVFSELLKLSGVADKLQEEGPFTVFAPTDKAFEDWGSDAVAELKADMTTLKSIIQNHVTTGTICCTGVSRSRWFNRQKVRMLSGELFPINKNRRHTTQISDSDVIECDVTATNGVVHVVDEVLVKNRGREQWEWMWSWSDV